MTRSETAHTLYGLYRVRELESAAEIYKTLVAGTDSAIMRSEIEKIMRESFANLSEEEKKNVPDVEMIIGQQLDQVLSPWFRYFVKYDPYDELKKVDVPLLALTGEKDLQVPPKENLAEIERAMGEAGNNNYKTAEMPGLNHLFQNAVTGGVSEYSKIEETFSVDALNMISGWILDGTGRK